MWNRRFRFFCCDADTGAGGGGGSEPAPSAPPAEASPDSKPPDTILTAPLEEDNPEPKDGQDQAAKPEQDKKPDPAEADQKPDKPEGYDLSFAEGTQVDTELLGQFQQAAHELGLSKGQAQKLADLYAGHTAEVAKKIEAAQNQAINDYINTQNAEFEKRPGFKEEVVLARKAMLEFGDQALADIFQASAMGSHPAMYEFMVKVGRALSEPGFKGSSGKAAETPIHERIYGKDGLGPAEASSK